jgi:hypothetical protein
MSKQKQATVFEVALLLHQWSEKVSKEPLTKQEWIEAMRKEGHMIHPAVVENAMKVAELTDEIFTTAEERLERLYQRVQLLEDTIRKFQ